LRRGLKRLWKKRRLSHKPKKDFLLWTFVSSHHHHPPFFSKRVGSLDLRGSRRSRHRSRVLELPLSEAACCGGVVPAHVSLYSWKLHMGLRLSRREPTLLESAEQRTRTSTPL